MKKRKIISFLVLVLVSLSAVSALSTSSSNYAVDVITSSGGVNISSSTYQTDIVLGTITGDTSSSTYQNFLGWFFGAGAIVAAANNPPNNPSVSINSTDGTNYATQDLNCFATISDNDTDNLDVTVRWYKNDSLNLTMNYNNNYVNGTAFNAVLDSANTTITDTWICSMRLYDSSAYSNWVNSSGLTIVAVPTTPPPSGGGGGGEGAAAVTSKMKITVEPTEFNIDLILNTNKERNIKVTNLGNERETIRISQNNLDKMVLFEEDSFELKPGESKEISVVFVALNETGIFTGKIIIGNKQVLVSLNIRTVLLLFDSNIIVLNKDYKVELGEKLRTQVTIIPMGDKERLDVTLNYVIKDYDGEIYLTKTETLFVQEQTDLKRDFDTGMLPLGDYIVGLELIYPNGVAPSSAHFEVVEKTSMRLIFYLIIGILLLLILILIILIIRHLLKSKKKIKRLGSKRRKMIHQKKKVK